MKTRISIFAAALFLCVSMTMEAQDIFEAVKNRDEVQVKQWIEKDASLVSLKDGSGNTPLHVAAIVGSPELILLLLSRGADIQAVNAQSNTPLHEAIINGHDDAARLLMEKGADVNKPDVSGLAPLHLAALYNRRAVASWLIDKGTDLESKEAHQWTPLGCLVRSTGNNEVAELLIQKGANINARDANGRTPLNNAAVYSSDHIIDLLLDRQAEIDTTPRILAMMLFSVTRRGHLRMFQYLADKGGAALFENEANNKTAMRNALYGGSLEMVRMLQARNIPLDVSADIEGLTPLHEVVSNPRALEIIEFLVKNGADIHARTNDGRSAYNIAEACGNKEACARLLKLGVNSEPQKFPVLTGPYMGQTPPGNEPVRFAPGIVSPDHGTITISPDGKEMYWGNGTAIMFSRIQNERWTKPEIVPFSGTGSLEFYDDVPFVTPDNKTIFFTSRRPLGPGSGDKENIWFAERITGGWSEPKPVGVPVNAMSLHWQVSVSKAKTLYFSGDAPGGYGLGDIYCSKWENGEYAKPVNLGPVINSENGESMPFIAPDESYLIFYKIILQRPSLHVSFRGKDGQWLPLRKIEPISYGVGAILSPDGKYLFCDNRWVSAKIIEDLKPSK